MTKINSIKILHTADWHLGKRLNQFSRHTEQLAVMDELCAIADTQQVDLVIVAGDLYDTFNPPAESQELFYKTIHRLTNNGKRAVVAIAGNHDMPERIEAPLPLANNCGIFLAGFPNSAFTPMKTDARIEITRSESGFIELSLPGLDFPVRILLTPYANELRLKTYLGQNEEGADLRNLLAKKWNELADKYCDDKGVNLLAAHLFVMKKDGEKEEEPEGEKTILHIGGAQEIYSENVPKGIQYVALGHLHKYNTVDTIPCPVVYSSSPLAYSFAEADQQKYVVVVELSPGKAAEYHKHELNKGFRLLRKTFDHIEDALIWVKDNPDAYVEVTLRTEDYIDGKSIKQLEDAHDKVVAIIPELIQKDEEGKTAVVHQVDLSQDLTTLFKAYFMSENQQEPTEAIMELFKEILKEEDK